MCHHIIRRKSAFCEVQKAQQRSLFRLNSRALVNRRMHHFVILPLVEELIRLALCPCFKNIKLCKDLVHVKLICFIQPHCIFIPFIPLEMRNITFEGNQPIQAVHMMVTNVSTPVPQTPEMLLQNKSLNDTVQSKLATKVQLLKKKLIFQKTPV